MPAPATPEAYLAALPADRRAVMETLHAAIRAAAPKLEPFLQSGIIGYGKFRYKSKSCAGDWFIVGLCARKAYYSLYICSADENGYLAEQAAPKLGKVKVGRSCITFKKPDDLDLKAALAVVKQAAKLGGMNAMM
ncbi:MAG: DUF1801 domain-containing protein [Opitutaceae bacterium]|nr:DUF1801 domain-containing protein [Opitutaceae bacterium]